MIQNLHGYFKFRIGGIWITLEYLLPVSIIFIGWLLSERYFPSIVFLSNPINYKLLGLLGSLSLLFSILFHEMGHALAAHLLNIQIERIHINLFGGMLELRHRPFIPTQDFFVSLAGPIASGVLALIFLIILSGISAKTQAVYYFLIQFVAYSNLLLTLFNLIPIYPLDGGRAVRAMIWKYKRNFYKASVLMHRFGSMLVGIFFIVISVLFFYVEGFYAFWFGLLGLYAAFLLMRSKKELISTPLLSDLIFKIDGEFTPSSIIQKILDVNPTALKNTVIPFFTEHQFTGVISGEKIIDYFNQQTDVEQLIEPISDGSFIDISHYSSFSNEIQFSADYVPIFNNKTFLGLCDASEMRFWLRQTSPNRKKYSE